MEKKVVCNRKKIVVYYGKEVNVMQNEEYKKGLP